MKSVSRSVFREGGFGPCSLYLDFVSVPVKIYLGNPYTIRKLLFRSFFRFFPFSPCFSFGQKNRFAKSTEFSRRGGKARYVTMQPWVGVTTFYEKVIKLERRFINNDSRSFRQTKKN